MSSHMSCHSSTAACSAGTAGAHVRPLQSLARRSAAACAPSCGASRLGGAARRTASIARDPVAAASRETSSSQPALQADPPTAPEAASQLPRQLLASVAKPLLLPLCAFLGGRLLAGLAAGSAAQLAGLALAAQVMAAAIMRVYDGTIKQELLVLFRQQARRRRASKQASRLAAATAWQRTEVQLLSLDFELHVVMAAALLFVLCMLEGAGRLCGFSVAAAVERTLRSDPLWAAMGERRVLPLLLEVGLALLAFSLFRVRRARSVFLAAAAERRRQNVERARRSAAGGGGQQPGRP